MASRWLLGAGCFGAGLLSFLANGQEIAPPAATKEPGIEAPMNKTELGQQTLPHAPVQSAATYAHAELSHLMNYYYEPDQRPGKRQPSVHTKLQLGAALYGGSLDLYTTLGAVKIAGTQKVIQRRPELEADYYPLRGTVGSLVIYNRVELPFSESEYDEENAKTARQGAIYTLGATPRVQLKTEIGTTTLLFSLASDTWTSFFSRRQFIGRDDVVPGDDRAIFLTRESDGGLHEAQEPRLHNEWIMGFGLYPLFVRGLLFEAAVVSTHDHKPLYFIDEDQSVSSKYVAERGSYYRSGFTYQINKTLSVANDFYHFHQGFFERRVTGLEDRRFRNIFKFACRL